MRPFDSVPSNVETKSALDRPGSLCRTQRAAGTRAMIFDAERPPPEGFVTLVAEVAANPEEGDEPSWSMDSWMDYTLLRPTHSWQARPSVRVSVALRARTATPARHRV